MTNKLSIDKMPKKGYCIVSFGGEMIFEPYEVRDGDVSFPGCERLSKELPREAHFFDSEREYRTMIREGTGEFLEKVLTAGEEETMDKDLIYVSEELVKEKFTASGKVPHSLTIVNRYEYCEHDTLVLKNYRIMVKE